MPKSIDRRRRARSVWDAGHPLWSVLKGAVALALLFVAGEHVGVTGHAGAMPDAKDGAGLVGLSIAAQMAWRLVRG